MSIEVLVSLLAAIGLGGILGAYFQSRFQHRKEVEEDIHQLKRIRYGSIIIQMLTILDAERGLAKIQEHRPDLLTIEDVKKEIQDEIMNSIMFANDAVINAMSEFILSPSNHTFVKTVSAMRKDLWGKDTKIGEDILKALVK